MVSGAVMFLLVGIALWVIIHFTGRCFGFLVEWQGEFDENLVESEMTHPRLGNSTVIVLEGG